MIKKKVIKYNLITLKEKKINKMSTLFYINTHVTHTRTIFKGFKNARKKTTNSFISKFNNTNMYMQIKMLKNE